MARNTRGATTPSEVFSATVSTAARATPASSSRWVSRPTIMLTARREAARSPDSNARKTFMLSSRRDLVAKICQHMALSRARASQGAICWHSHRRAAGTSQDRAATHSHRASPASFSPWGVLGKRRRKSFSKPLMSLPMRTTGWGMLWGSPRIRSTQNPITRGAREIRTGITIPHSAGRYRDTRGSAPSSGDRARRPVPGPR